MGKAARKQRKEVRHKGFKRPLGYLRAALPFCTAR